MTIQSSVRNNASAQASQKTRIDIGGRKLAFECAGQGAPVVILETGLGAESSEWAAVAKDVSKIATVVRYDRANRGASDPAPTPRTALEMRHDLRALLSQTGIGGPYVLVGHSFGGLLMRLFAYHHSSEVAGLVLVDSMHEDQFGVFGPMFPPPFPSEPAELTKTRTFWQGGWRDPASTQEGIDFLKSIKQAREVTSLGNIPLHVITAGTFLNQRLLPEKMRPALQTRWQDLQMEFLKLSSRATHSLVLESGHFVQRDAPETVSSAIKALIAFSRSRP